VQLKVDVEAAEAATRGDEVTCVQERHLDGDNRRASQRICQGD